MMIDGNLSFVDLRRANENRCGGNFHPIDLWSPADWGVAMGGECGEALNLIKKLRRLDDGHQLANIPRDRQKIIESIGMELADMIIYADILACRLGLDLGEEVRSKFDIVSARVGSDIRLGSGK